MAKKIGLIISADNSPAVKAVSELTVALGKMNAAFRSINVAQRAEAKKTGKGSGGIFDPKELDAVGQHLKTANDMIKGIGTTMNGIERDSGFRGLSKGFEGVTDSASGFLKVVSSLIPEIGALTGAGAIGGIASLAGAFADKAQRTKQEQHETGLPSSYIQRFNNKMGVAGIPADQSNAALSGITANVRDAIYGQNSTLFGLLTSKQGLGFGNDIVDRFKDPKQRPKLIDDIINRAISREKETPTLVQALDPALGTGPLARYMMQDDPTRAAIDAAAANIPIQSNKQMDDGTKSAIARSTAISTAGGYLSKIGAHLSPFSTAISNFMTDSMNGKYTLDKNGISREDVQAAAMRTGSIDFGKKSSLAESLHNWFGFGDGNTPTIGNDQSSMGIPLSGNAPADQKATIILDIQGAPKGSTVKVAPNSTLNVQPRINHAGSGF